MVTCPDCLGYCNEKEIQLEIIDYEDGEYFFCPRCKNFSQLEMLDPDLEEGIIMELRNMKEVGKK